MLRTMRQPFAVFATAMLSAALLCTLQGVSDAQDVTGCGGFVQIPFGDNAQDMVTKVKVLLSRGNIVKNSAVPAPNGYYFLPLYESLSADYTLSVSGPDGWHFDPETVSVSDSLCASRDISFSLTGFSVSGRVQSASGSSKKALSGPEGVTVVLRRDGETAHETKTSHGGQYTFTNVPPAIYTLSFSHPEWEIETSATDSLQIAVEDSNVEIEEVAMVTGYSITGIVSSYGTGISGVPVSLSLSGSTKPLSTVKSEGEKGVYTFSGIPVDLERVYEIRCMFEGFEVVPEVVRDVKMDLPGNLDLSSTPFSVTGFWVSGYVREWNRDPIADVQVSVKGSGVDEVVRTDKEGKYSLSLRQGVYTFSVVETERDSHFDAMENVEVSPAAAEVPDLHAHSYKLCTTVSITSKEFEDAKMTLRIDPMPMHEKSFESSPRSLSLSPSEAQCLSLPVGVYTQQLPQEWKVYIEIAEEREREGLMLLPAETTVVMQTGDQSLHFRQLLDTIESHIITSAISAKSLSLHLLPDDIYFPVADGVVVGKGKGATNTYSVVFEGLKPRREKRRVEVRGEREREMVECFEESVDAETGVTVFTQVGYHVNIISASSVVLPYTLELQKKTFTVSKAEMSLCVPTKENTISVGKVTPSENLSDCVKYSAAEKSVKIGDTISSITVSASAYKFSGHISLPNEKDSLSLSISDSETGKKESVSMKGTGTFTHWASPSSTLSLSLSQSPSPHYVYTPESGKWPLTVSVAEKVRECTQEDLKWEDVEFVRGIYVRGSVISSEPLTESLSLRLLSLSLSADVKVGEREIDIGPLAPVDGWMDMEIEGEADGYAVKAVKDENKSDEKKGILFYEFHCKKLSFIDVSTFTQISESRKSLPHTLVSVSSSDPQNNSYYRNNTYTGSETGSVRFDTLAPGEYYVRPFHKEFTFTPEYQNVRLEDGKSLKVEFEGTRVAYSLPVYVRSLNPLFVEAGAVLQAVPTESAQATEECRTSPEGICTFHGLLPKINYVIQVDQTSPHNAKYSHTIPRTQLFHAKSLEDVDTESDALIEMVLVRANAVMEISGDVEIVVEGYRGEKEEDELVQGLTVDLIGINRNDEKRVISSFDLKSAKFPQFTFGNIKRTSGIESYAVTLRSNSDEFSRRHWKEIQTEENVEVGDFEAKMHSVPLKFYARAEYEKEEVRQSSFFTMLIVVIGVIGYLNREDVRAFYDQYLRAHVEKFRKSNESGKRPTGGRREKSPLHKR